MDKVIVLRDFAFRSSSFISCGIKMDNPVVGKTQAGEPVRAHTGPELYLILRHSVPGTASITTMVKTRSNHETLALYGHLLQELGAGPEEVRMTLEDLGADLPPLTPIQ